MHKRLVPKVHRFVYPLYYYAFDLDELEELDRRFWFFGYNRVSLISLHDRDYLRNNGGTIKEKLLRYLSKKPYSGEISRVVLLTSARYCNYVFNPVSFFYCYDVNGKLLAIVAEVNNTFGERHPYVLDEEIESSKREGFFCYQARKAFHVSPFNDVQGEYYFKFSEIKDKLFIGIDMIRENELAFKAGLSGQGLSFSRENVIKTIARFPLSVFLTMPRICWQAAKLYFVKKLTIYTKPSPESAETLYVAKPGLFESLAKRLVFRCFEKAVNGRLRVLMPDGAELGFGSEKSETSAYLHIKSYKFFTKVVVSGDVGFGEAYTEGLWDTDDLTSLLKFFILNEKAEQSNNQLLSRFGEAINRLRHLCRKNTLSGSRKNISAHYDLSNELFRCFLDESMTYSAGCFSADDSSLEGAQARKLKKLVEKAEISKDDHVLEIGCGWGSFAVAAAMEIGCRVTGVTLSKEQLSFARERVRALGLEDRVSLELCDYRNIKGRFDKIVSVEMIEAVGHENLGAFFASCERLLKPGGKMVLQAITIIDEKYEAYRRRCDWIQKHIFPGGCLPSVGRLSEVVSRNSGLEFQSLETMGIDYAMTLKIWKDRFNSSRDKVLALGFDEYFIRSWNYYFSYCEAGFLAGPINTVQLVLARPWFKDAVVK